MRKRLSLLGLVMAFVMVFSVGVSASWNQYQGSDTHVGTITDVAPLTSSLGTLADTDSHVGLPALNYSGSGWSGVDTTPVMEVFNNNTYAYVIYNGFSNGAQLSRINCADNSVTSLRLSIQGSFQLSTPYLDTAAGTIYVAAGNYYNILANNEFATTGSWVLPSGVTIDTADESVTVPAGKTISQTFNYALSSSSKTQLTSGIKLVSGTSATVTYTLTKPDGTSVTLATQDVTSTDTWTYLEELGSGDVHATGDYTISVAVTGGTVKLDYVTYSRQTSGISAVDRNLTTKTPVGGTEKSGQINTPVMKYGNYIYYGTYNGGYKYYQVYVGATGNGHTYGDMKVFTGNNHFYWAGAIRVAVNGTDYIVFGGDGGYLYCTPEANFGDSTATKVYNLSTLGSVTAGNVRSSISSDGTYIYFTSQGGYLWRASIASLPTGSLSVSKVVLGGTSTSTPAISSNGKIYVGYYNGFNAGGVQLVKASTFASAVNVTDPDTEDVDKIFNNPVQSSVVVYSSGTTDYVYFTTNCSGGAGYCYQVNRSNAAAKMWQTTGSTYTLQGMAACNGYLTFGNDHNKFYVIH